MSETVVYVKFLRNETVESVHKVNVFTENSDSELFFPRSSVKPFQIIPLLVESEKKNIFFDSNEIALFGSSHSGEQMHVELLNKISHKYEIDLDLLFCGPQRPFFDTYADQILKSGESFSSQHNNCSGKHLSMLIFSKILNEDLNGYQNLNHPIQIYISKFFSEIFEDNNLEYSTDGCGLPAVKVSSHKFLLALKKIQSSKYQKFFESVFDAYTKFPEIIGGTNRTDTNIMKASNGKVMAKSGAEGVLIVTNKVKSYIFKCLDGNKRGVDLAATNYLNKIGLINEEPYNYLKSLYSKNLQDDLFVDIKIN